MGLHIHTNDQHLSNAKQAMCSTSAHRGREARARRCFSRRRMNMKDVNADKEYLARVSIAGNLAVLDKLTTSLRKMHENS